MIAQLDTIEVDVRDGVGHIKLNRPDRRNAINRQLKSDVTTALDEFVTDASVRSVLVTGAGPAFCSGFDLKDDADDAQHGVAAWRKTLSSDFEFLFRFWEFPKPTVSGVHGFCIAGGCDIALTCDITVADEQAIFGKPELSFGSVITLLLLPWLTGPKQAKELLLTGADRITAQTAMELGLVNRIVPSGSYEEAAFKLARDIASLDSDAVRLTKRAINRSLDIMGLREALAAGLDAAVQVEALETPSRIRFREITLREGLKAAIAWRESNRQEETNDNG